MKIYGILNSEDIEFENNRKLAIFCIENAIPYPKEVEEYFKGKIDGDSLNDLQEKYVFDYLKNLNEKRIVEEYITYEDIPNSFSYQTILDIEQLSKIYSKLIITSVKQ